jgi:DNA-binding SARP family transcriptional activator
MLVKLHINCLGVPELLAPEGKAVAVPTRKALAILVYLLRTPGGSAPREQLADILWSKVPRERAIQSLRQALKQIRQMETASGCSFLVADKARVTLTAGALVSDFSLILELLKTGSAEAFEAALAMMRGPLLNGYENLDPVFQEWLFIERQRLGADMMSAALKVVEKIAVDEEPERVEAGCMFLLALDSTYEHAHQILIRMYLATNRRAEAQQQLKRCEAELHTHLDAQPDRETYLLFEQAETVPQQVRPVDPLTAMAQIGGGQFADTDRVRQPELSILTFTPSDKIEKRAQTVLDEIRTSLGACRNFDLYESSYRPQANTSELTHVDGGELGSYLLRFRYDEMNRSVYLQLENRTSGQILFNEVVELAHMDDEGRMREMAYQTVNRVRSQIIGGLRKRPSSAPFARWCHAEALLWEFSPSADKKAIPILEELMRSHPTFSVAYAGKASVILKQMLHYPSFGDPPVSSEDALNNAERAVSLDPWQVVNRRMHGWALLQQGYYDDAKRSFLEAARINPFDPTNLMSVAEGLAYVGDVDLAQKTADRAFRLFPVIPRVFYEYLATIHFAAGDFTTAVEFLERAPVDGIFSVATRVAALICADRESEALATLELLKKRTTGLRQDARPGQPEQIGGWLKQINLYKNPQTRMNYRRGADVVREYLLQNWPEARQLQ